MPPPPCGRFCCAVPTTSPPGGHGNGSSNIAVGWPLFTQATKFVIASGDNPEGCTASSTSYLSSIGFDASTSTTSYCFFSSATNFDSSVGPCIEKPPNNGTSV